MSAQPPVPAPKPQDTLTPRQWEVLRLIAEGIPTRDVAAALGIKPHSVLMHLTRAYQKIGMSNRIELVHWYLLVPEARKRRNGVQDTRLFGTRRGRPPRDRFAAQARAGGLRCPRGCAKPLLEFQPSARWKRYFRCPECWADFHFENHVLVQGREPNASE